MNDRQVPVLARLLATISVGISGVIAWNYTVVDPDLNGCSFLGLPPRTTLAILCVTAISGWAFALWQIIPTLVGIFRTSPSLATATDQDVCAALEEAKSVQIFVSRSDRVRSLITTHAKRLPRGLKLQVLVRDDGTPERGALIAAEAQKWRNDVGKFGIALQIHTYKFDPVMFRGLLFDRRTAILGWYYRGSPLKQGHDLDMFLISNAEIVEQISTAFDDMFARGTEL